MDLNEVPNDLMVNNGVKIEEEKMVNLDDLVDKKLGFSRIEANEVKEEKGFVFELEIKNRVMKLEDIEAKIRVLEDEKLKVEEEIRELKKRKEEEVEDGGGGGGVREKKGSGGGRGDSPHVLTPVSKRKREVMVVTSDGSDDECVPDRRTRRRPNRRAFKIENSDNESDENEVLKIDSDNESDESDDECEITTGCRPNRRARRIPNKRVLKIENSDNEGDENEVLKIGSESEIESESESDDHKPISQLKIGSESESESESESDDHKPISQLMNRRVLRSSSQTEGAVNRTRPRRRLVKYRQRDKPQEVENDNHPDVVVAENGANDELSDEESGSSDKSLSNFIVDDDSEDENAANDALKDDLEDHSVELEGESDDDSDSNLDFEDIISRLQSRRDPNSKWTSEGDMLSDFGKNPELCLRAVCALYRQQTNDEKVCGASLISNGRGFSKFDAARGTRLGKFLTDGDPNGDLVKSVEELKEFDPYGLEECRTLANHYSKQLFNIYENGEDPFFP